GRLEFTGTIGALRGDSEERFAVRVKDGLDKLAGALAAAGLDARRDGEELSLLLPGGDTDAVFAAARAAGVQIRHLAPLKRSLEAAFLEKVKACPRAPRSTTSATSPTAARARPRRAAS